jgi:hypothetical protein
LRRSFAALRNNWPLFSAKPAGKCAQTLCETWRKAAVAKFGHCCLLHGEALLGFGGPVTTNNSVFINQAPWYIKQRVKTVTELARHSSENTLSLS